MHAFRNLYAYFEAAPMTKPASNACIQASNSKAS